MIPIFYQPWYLDAIIGADSWLPIVYLHGDDPRAIWPIYLKEKWGQRYITLPPLTPQLGPWYHIDSTAKRTTRLSHIREYLTGLTELLPQHLLLQVHCDPALNYWIPMHTAGYQLHQRYTYRISLRDTDDMWADIDTKQRNRIRKAQSSIRIQLSDDKAVFWELNQMTYDRQDRSMPYSQEYVETWDAVLSANGSSRLYLAYVAEQAIAGIYIVHDQRCAYLMAIGSDPAHSDTHAVSSLIWKAIQDYSTTHAIFDFEGSMIPRIESFFRSFGGVPTSYTRLVHTPNQMVDAALRLIGKL